MPTISMPPKKSGDDLEVLSIAQGRPKLNRYLLRVDGQTKASFKDKADAEKRGREIKSKYPIVEVIVRDTEESQNFKL